MASGFAFYGVAPAVLYGVELRSLWRAISFNYSLFTKRRLMANGQRRD